MGIVSTLTNAAASAAAATVAVTAAGGAAAGIIGSLTKNNSNLSAFLQPGSSLYFPGDLGSTKFPYYISFSFAQYQRRSIYDRAFLKDSGMVRLPPPNQLVDSNDVTYSQEDTGLIYGVGIDAAIRANTNLSDKVGAVAAAGISGAVAGAAAGASALAGSVATAGANILSISGVAVNPFMTVLFKAPTFKKHRFSWTLNATNASESETIRNIVNKFKYHQLPDVTSAPAGSLLSYPDIVNIGLYPNNYYLYDFKPCVVESFSAVYSTDGQPAYFATTDAPVTVTIDMTLLEIEYFLRQDIISPVYKTTG